jgi:hypothetical protein
MNQLPLGFPSADGGGASGGATVLVTGIAAGGSRLKGVGITPVLCTDSGAQTAFYYEDPDRNSVELNVDNYGDSWTSTEHLRTSPEFAKNPMGKYVDPDKMVAAREAGASPWELHERAWTGEFAPAKPYDPRILL